eukprot:gene18149-20669_t
MGCGASTSKPVQPLVEKSGTTGTSVSEANLNRIDMKVLMLGTGESGRTTVVKQIQRVVNTQEASKIDYKQQIRRNALMAIQTLIQAGEELNVASDDMQQKLISKQVMSLDAAHADSLLRPELAKTIHDLWQSPAMQKVYARRAEFWSSDATSYYLNEVERIASANFEPNEQDLLMTRVRSTGVAVSEIIERPYRFQFVDVGGQRNERRKWAQCYEDVKLIVYVVSLPGYCQVMFEDSRVNIMNESLAVFEDIVKNPLFKSTPIYVFLNKKDIFEEMVSSHPLRQYFPDYNGDAGVDPAVNFIKQKFRDIAKVHVPGKALQFCVVSALERNDIKAAFLDVKNALKRLHPVRKATAARMPENTYISTN